MSHQKEKLNETNRDVDTPTPTTASLQLLDIELAAMQQKFRSGKLRAFGSENNRNKLLERVGKIRDMQMETFKIHMNMELGWEDQDQQGDFESEHFCGNFEDTFNTRAREVEEITSKLHSLSHNMTLLSDELHQFDSGEVNFPAHVSHVDRIEKKESKNIPKQERLSSEMDRPPPPPII
eukprot:g6025.t1